MNSDGERAKAALARVGLVLDDVYDILNIRKRSPEVIEILIGLLGDAIKDPRVKEGVVRGLATREARGKAGPSLIKEFDRTPRSEFALRWVIGNSVDVVMTDDLVSEVARIVTDKSNGKAREMFVLALGKIRSDIAEQTLLTLLDDDEVVAHAVIALGKMRSRRATEPIKRLLEHPRALVRKEAKRALERIQK
ncbi:MAG: HEAT repeat domain-containing protein [candidate division Zixibacteria bacterium]|nr:HEAT repeat domain-containing protein [candidate division Zixibacteria bacterium]